MSQNMHDEMNEVRLRPTCVNLRHKLMYVDERQAIPGMVDSQSDTRIYFCTLSGDPLGPDAEPVSPGDCTCDRACYEPGARERA